MARGVALYLSVSFDEAKRSVAIRLYNYMIQGLAMFRIHGQIQLVTLVNYATRPCELEWTQCTMLVSVSIDTGIPSIVVLAAVAKVL